MPDEPISVWPAAGTPIPELGHPTTTYEQLELPISIPEFDDGGSGREYTGG